MRTNSRIRGQLLVLAALAVVVSVPELARAQQAGLFPLAPIRRQRVPCDQEDPIYKIYKNKYFGYHPTCWRQFPAGWGCPSPAAPNIKESLEKIPFAGGQPRGELATGEGEEGMEPQSGPSRPARPPLPAGPSPFETNDPAAPPTNPRGGARPSPAAPIDPFELDRPAAPAVPRSGGPGAASNGPELSAPADQPATRTSQMDATDNPNDSVEVAPVLALPSVDVPPLDDHPGVPFGVQPPSANANVASNSDTNPNAAAAASPAPRRGGVLSGFFSNLGLNWTRR